MSDNHFGEFYFDILREIGNIGMGSAATSLSMLCGKNISIDVPKAKRYSIDELVNLAGNEEEPILSIFIKLESGIEGNMFFIFKEKTAEHFIKMALNKKKKTSDFDAFDLATLSEVGNILFGSYISSLSNFLDINITYSIPETNYDMAGALLTHNLTQNYMTTDKAFVVHTAFSETEDDYDGYIIYLPNSHSIDVIQEKARGMC